MVLVWLLIIGLYLWLCYYIATLVEKAARLKGYDSDYHILAISFWLGPIGWMYATLLPDLVERENTKKLIEAQTNIYIALTKGEASGNNTIVAIEDDELPPL